MKPRTVLGLALLAPPALVLYALAFWVGPAIDCARRGCPWWYGPIVTHGVLAFIGMIAGGLVAVLGPTYWGHRYP